MEVKVCGGGVASKHGCGASLPIDQFFKAKERADGLSSYCKSCSNERNKKYRHKNPEKFRGYNVKKLYGVTQDEYEELLKSQSHKCAVCGEKEQNVAKGRLHVDHCHDTGSVRGLLCSKCNTALGLLDDDTRRMEKLIKYTRRANGQ